MFALRGLAVSLSVFVAIYCGLSLLLALTWRRAHALLQGQPAHRLAISLFALRMLPLAAGVLVTATLAVPSFLLLEPRAISEPIGELSLTLGFCGVVVLTIGAANAVLSLRRASRTISQWANAAEPVCSTTALPVFRAAGAVPPMTAVGIIRPQILLSRAAEFVLNANEFQSALNHEIAHVRRRDNLKKLLLRFVQFPFMSGLEQAWMEATEMSADDAAVSTPAEALDLAAALIKLCRLGPMDSSAELTMSLVHSPISLVNERVERLIHWSPQSYSNSGSALWYIGGFVFGSLAVGLSYGHLLVAAHIVTEWLMR